MEEPESLGPRSRLARYLQDAAYEEELIDLLVIDEAHYLRNPETLTAKIENVSAQRVRQCRPPFRNPNPPSQ